MMKHLQYRPHLVCQRTNALLKVRVVLWRIWRPAKFRSTLHGKESGEWVILLLAFSSTVLMAGTHSQDGLRTLWEEFLRVPLDCESRKVCKGVKRYSKLVWHGQGSRWHCTSLTLWLWLWVTPSLTVSMNVTCMLRNAKLTTFHLSYRTSFHRGQIKCHGLGGRHHLDQ